jgi:hypothetical protein
METMPELTEQESGSNHCNGHVSLAIAILLLSPQLLLQHPPSDVLTKHKSLLGT